MVLACFVSVSPSALTVLQTSHSGLALNLPCLQGLCSFRCLEDTCGKTRHIDRRGSSRTQLETVYECMTRLLVHKEIQHVRFFYSFISPHSSGRDPSYRETIGILICFTSCSLYSGLHWKILEKRLWFYFPFSEIPIST